jgi:hypothetical protein
VGDLDTSGLLAGDIVASLHSFRRRFAAALDPERFVTHAADEPAAARLAALTQHTTDDTTGLERLSNATAVVDEASSAVATLALGGGGLVADPTEQRGSSPPRPASVTDVEAIVRDLLDGVARLAARLAALPSAGWTAAGTSTSGQPTDALRLGRAVVGVLADHLRALERCATNPTEGG